jgi:hypothetical protein
LSGFIKANTFILLFRGGLFQTVVLIQKMCWNFVISFSVNLIIKIEIVQLHIESSMVLKVDGNWEFSDKNWKNTKEKEIAKS